MSQPITVSVTMDAASFRRFRWFDLLQHNRIWKRPLVGHSVGFCRGLPHPAEHPA